MARWAPFEVLIRIGDQDHFKTHTAPKRSFFIARRTMAAVGFLLVPKYNWQRRLELSNQKKFCYEPGLAPVNQNCMISVYWSCQEPGLAPVNQKCVIPVYRSCQEPDLAPVNQKFVFSVYRSCQEPGLAPVNQKCMILVYRSCYEPGLAPVNQNASFRFTGAARSQAWLR